MVVGIGVGVAMALVGVTLRISMQPKTFRIVRSRVIAAPCETAFGFVNEFHRWPQWSPWAQLDPHMTIKFHGPDSGVGSVYEWSGNNKVGAGKMTIRESQPPRRIGLELQFLRPMAATNEGEFSFEPVPEGVRVTWAMTGSNNFMGKAFSLVVNVDKMVGKDFERGLATLQTLAEAEASRRSIEAPRAT